MRVYITISNDRNDPAEEFNIGRCSSVRLEVEHDTAQFEVEQDKETGEVRVLVRHDSLAERECVYSYVPEVIDAHG